MANVFAHPEVHLQDYIYILKKRRIIVFLAFFIVLLMGIFLTFRAKVLYRATTTILIERENPNIVDFKEVMAFDASSTDYYQTQYQMLESRSLIDTLIDEEDLRSDPYLRGMQKGSLRKLVRGFSFLPEWLDPFMADKSLEGLIRSRVLQVEPVRNSRLVSVSIEHPDPKKAAEMANSLVRLFIKKNLESRFVISQQARDLLSEQLEELKEKVADTEKKLQLYKEEHGLINIPSIHEKDKFTQEAKLELLKLQSEEVRLAKRYLPAHPKYIHIHSQVEALKEKIEEEEKKNLLVSRVAIDYDELEREAQSARQIYETLLGRFQEMHSEAKTQASNVIVVDYAEAPERPYKPKPFRNIMISIVLGFILGTCLAFLSEYLDSTIKIPDDVEKGLGLELLGIIPLTSKSKKAPLKGEVFLHGDQPSQAAEAFRALRTALLFKLRHVSGCRVVLVTSPNPEEGKSTVSLNLAVAFQQNNLKVLLVDSDMRKPRLHRRLDVDPQKGFSNVLEENIAPSEAIQHNLAGVELDFLSSGSQSQRPTEILGGAAMRGFVEEMRSEYDIIIIDSPPYLAVADVAVLSEFADAMVVVAKYQQTDRRHLKDIRKRFAEMRNKLLGVVINQVSVKERDYYYQQYYYYGYGEKTARK